MNSFKELENDQIRLFAEARHKRVYDRVYGSLGSLRFISSIIEMYVPVMADTVVSLTGGSSLFPQENVEEESTDSNGDIQRPPSGPALPDDDETDIPRIN
ncbi:hypothetical protein CEQ90_07020 [Lewinellaceae bacterium SD302]|nr:hypothetical protein CEQ90_07020 [Lewinellaceae bacterium SD302]